MLIEAGDANGSDLFDPAVEWDGFAIDTFHGLGAHPGVRRPRRPSEDEPGGRGG